MQALNWAKGRSSHLVNGKADLGASVESKDPAKDAHFEGCYRRTRKDMVFVSRHENQLQKMPGKRHPKQIREDNILIHCQLHSSCAAIPQWL